MKYALLIRESAEDFATRDNSPATDPYRQGWLAYTQALQQAGVMVGGAGLQAPETGTIVRRRGDKRDVQDGQGLAVFGVRHAGRIHVDGYVGGKERNSRHITSLPHIGPKQSNMLIIGQAAGSSS